MPFSITHSLVTQAQSHARVKHHFTAAEQQLSPDVLRDVTSDSVTERLGSHRIHHSVTAHP